MLQVTSECRGFVLSDETRNINSCGSIGRLTRALPLHGVRAPENRPHPMPCYGCNGTLIAGRPGYELIPETGLHGGSLGSREAFLTGEVKPAHKAGTGPSALHARHSVRCMRDGETPRSVVVTGHRSSLVAHLGDVACLAWRKRVCDAERDRIVNVPAASPMLGRKARKPWDANGLYRSVPRGAALPVEETPVPRASSLRVG